MPDSLHKKVGAASLIMIGSIFLSRVIGLFREMTIAYIGGATAEVDAYQVAFVIPEILNHVAASGFLSITFIPIFSSYLVQERPAEGWRVFSAIMTLFGTGLVILTIAAWMAAGQLIDLLAPGIQDPATRALALEMTRIILPAQVFFFCGGLLMAVQYASESFLIPALAPLGYNLGIIAGGVMLGPTMGMKGFAWGVLAGAFVSNFALQWFGARRVGLHYRPSFDFRHPDVRKYVWLTLPLMFGLTMTFSTELFLKFFGSFLPAGGIAALNYGIRVMFMMVGVFGQALGVAAFPFMAKLAAAGRIDEMNDLLNRSLRYLALVIPFSILMMILSRETVVVLFQHGRFDISAAGVTAGTLVFLMGGAVAFAAQTVVVRGFYAVQDTLTPAIFSTVAVLLSIPLYIVGVKGFGVYGVGAAISLSALFQVGLLYHMWNRRSGNIGQNAVYRLYGKLTGIGILLGGLTFAFKRLVFSGLDVHSKTDSLTAAVVVSVVFVILLYAAGRIGRVPEIGNAMERVVSRMRRS